jgi:hypothetical protein
MNQDSKTKLEAATNLHARRLEVIRQALNRLDLKATILSTTAHEFLEIRERKSIFHISVQAEEIEVILYRFAFATTLAATAVVNNHALERADDAPRIQMTLTAMGEVSAVTKLPHPVPFSSGPGAVDWLRQLDHLALRIETCMQDLVHLAVFLTPQINDANALKIASLEFSRANEDFAMASLNPAATMFHSQPGFRVFQKGVISMLDACKLQVMQNLAAAAILLIVLTTLVSIQSLRLTNIQGNLRESTSDLAVQQLSIEGYANKIAWLKRQPSKIQVLMNRTSSRGVSSTESQSNAQSKTPKSKLFDRFNQRIFEYDDPVVDSATRYQRIQIATKSEEVGTKLIFAVLNELRIPVFAVRQPDRKFMLIVGPFLTESDFDQAKSLLDKTELFSDMIILSARPFDASSQ